MTTESPPESTAEIEHCSDPAGWDAFVDRVDGPPFARWGWYDAVDTYGHDRWNVVVRRDGEIVGALPLVHIRNRVFGSKLVSPPFGERGGPLLANRADTDTCNRLLTHVADLADELRVDFVSLRGVEQQVPDEIGTSNGAGPTTEAGIQGRLDEFEGRERFVTFRIPLHGTEDDRRERIKSSRRRQIRQVEENPDLTYEIGDSMDQFREYYRLYLRSVRGHGTPAHSFAFYRQLWQSLAAEGALRLSLIRRHGEVINGMLNLASGSTVSQWGVVNDYDYRDLNGGSYLLWKSMARAAEDGFETYELGRTREGSGVYMFKKSFGGEKHWYRDLHYFPSEDGALPHPDQSKYDPIKHVWKRLPIAATRLLGPPVRKHISL
jgi:CelD/BcsL family acetyltransferase involved in cellulose biosynthesis